MLTVRRRQGRRALGNFRDCPERDAQPMSKSGPSLIHAWCLNVGNNSKKAPLASEGRMAKYGLTGERRVANLKLPSLSIIHDWSAF